jgi:hypothetical protein
MKKPIVLISSLAAILLLALVFKVYIQSSPPDPNFTSGILVAEDETGKTVLTHYACDEAPTLRQVHITMPGGGTMDGCWRYDAPYVNFVDSKTLIVYKVKLSLFHHEDE